MSGLDAFRAAMDLTPEGDNAFTGTNTAEGHGVIFGGQMLAQSIVAASRLHDGKGVRSLHTIFTRGGKTDSGVTVSVEPLHAGRSFASADVSVTQGDRLCCRSLLLLDAPDEDLVAHESPMPDVEAPPADGAADGGHASDGWWQCHIAGGVDLSDPAVGPATLDAWIRFPDIGDDPVISRAALAYASDGFLIGTAMRPHEGLNQSMAHVSVATTVLTHTISFHDDFTAADWLLLSHESIRTGGGRAHGRATVHTTDGRHVASFSQDSMLRAMPTDGRPG